MDYSNNWFQNGKEAFQTWQPNLIYVQGGNTFWLYHCIEKGDWGDDIVKACTGRNPAVYCGTSAGAIVMGQSMDTACWKVGATTNSQNALSIADPNCIAHLYSLQGMGRSINSSASSKLR